MKEGGRYGTNFSIQGSFLPFNMRETNNFPLFVVLLADPQIFSLYTNNAAILSVFNGPSPPGHGPNTDNGDLIRSVPSPTQTVILLTDDIGIRSLGGC